MSAPDFVIVGGGVVGLSVAYALALEQASVTVLDAGLPGQASAAAAGMLAPLAEARQSSPFVPLGVESLRLWPSFVDGLQEEFKTALCLAGPGMLRVACTEAEDAALCEALGWQRGLGLPLHRLNAAEARAFEPALSSGVCGGVFSPQERHVEPRLLLQALTAACARRGVVIQSQARVTAIDASRSRMTALRTEDAVVSGGAYVVTGGAWSAALGITLGAHFPIHPLRGQMAALGPLQPLPFRHTIYAHNGYLVPRADGRVLAGATEERAGFDAQTTVAGIGTLRALAEALVPSLAAAPQHSIWAGLRPVSADGLPLLGRVPGWDNIHVAAGHGRNGILLTPLTGRLMAAHLLHHAALPPAVDPARFDGGLEIGDSA